jgi:hypothetical protein
MMPLLRAAQSEGKKHAAPVVVACSLPGLGGVQHQVFIHDDQHDPEGRWLKK